MLCLSLSLGLQHWSLVRGGSLMCVELDDYEWVVTPLGTWSCSILCGPVGVNPVF